MTGNLLKTWHIRNYFFDISSDHILMLKIEGMISIYMIQLTIVTNINWFCIQGRFFTKGPILKRSNSIPISVRRKTPTPSEN